jgi:hypothetical protein
MTIRKKALAIPSFIAVALLSACSSGGSATTGAGTTTTTTTTTTTPAVTQYLSTSAVVLPTGSGTIYANLNSAQGDADIDVEGDGYAYQIGTDADGNFVAVAGTVTDGSLPTVATSGTATYSGTYSLVHLDRANAADATGLITESSGDFTLTADLAAKTFTGKSTAMTTTAEGDKLVLYTQGSYNAAGVMDGMVRYRDEDAINIRADMAGEIGANKVLGAFQGGDDDVDMIAGGFNAIAN